MTDRHLVLGALGLALFGWSLVAAADARHAALPAQTEVVVRTVRVEPESAWDLALQVETPILDSLVDWDAWERETECLWEFLRASGVELSLASVLAAGDWTDALGGACLVIGEHNEPDE